MEKRQLLEQIQNELPPCSIRKGIEMLLQGGKGVISTVILNMNEYLNDYDKTGAFMLDHLSESSVKWIRHHAAELNKPEPRTITGYFTLNGVIHVATVTV